MSRIWQTIRRIGLEIYSFFTAPFVVKNCLGMFSLMGALLLITLWWLKCYTQHGESVEVPNFEGMTYKAAQRSSEGRDFTFAITDSVYISGKIPGEIITQNPKAKSRVKEGRTIYCTIVKNTADMVTLPGLVGNDDYDLYAKQCTRLNIRTRISARVQDARLEPNTILAVINRSDTITNLLRRGHKVEMGTTLDFVVSEAATTEMAIPALTCLTYDEAKFLLSSSGLVVGQVFKDASVTDAGSAFIWRQSPAPAEDITATAGQAIDLYLTQSLPQNCQ